MKPLMLFVIGLVLGAGIGLVGGMGLDAPASAHIHDDSHAHTPEDLAGAASDNTAHATLLDIGADRPAPTIALELIPVAGGYSLHIRTENFAFSPESVDHAAVAGEGHAHVYVDGIKVLRALGAWVDLPGLTAGSLIRVDLMANSHATLALGDTPISATIAVPAD